MNNTNNQTIYAVSMFKNYYETIPSKIVNLEKWLLNNPYKDKVLELRQCQDPEERAKLKKSIPCITPSGVFSKRCSDGLVKHSGLVCVEIDNLSPQKAEIFKASIGERYSLVLYYAGLSVSGNGVFFIIRIRDTKHHYEHYHALIMWLKRAYPHVEFDASCVNLSRTRIASYDPNPIFNPEPKAFVFMRQCHYPRVQNNRTFGEKREVDLKVLRLVEIIKAEKVDITIKYSDWVTIGKALAAEYGDYGEFIFHEVSRIYPEYNEGDCGIQYRNCMKNVRNTTIASFFYICSQYGLTVPRRLGRE